MEMDFGAECMGIGLELGFSDASAGMGLDFNMNMDMAVIGNVDVMEARMVDMDVALPGTSMLGPSGLSEATMGMGIGGDMSAPMVVPVAKPPAHLHSPASY